MENPFADILKDIDYTYYKRLSFEEQCAFYAALRLDVPPAAVAKAAGVSQGSVSLLSRAGSFVSGQLRYGRVYREWNSLGQDAFVKKYLNAWIRERLAQAIDVHKRRKGNPDINEKGYNPRANRYVGGHQWPKTSVDNPAEFIIELSPAGRGYFWRNLRPFYGKAAFAYAEALSEPACALQGDPARDNGRLGFVTSEACYRYVKSRLNPTAAQLAKNYP